MDFDLSRSYRVLHQKKHLMELQRKAHEAQERIEQMQTVISQVYLEPDQLHEVLNLLQKRLGAYQWWLNKWKHARFEYVKAKND